MNGDDKLGDVSVRMSELAEKEKLIDKKNNGGKSAVQAKNDVQKQSLASQMKKKVAIDCIKLKIEIENWYWRWQATASSSSEPLGSASQRASTSTLARY